VRNSRKLTMVTIAVTARQTTFVVTPTVRGKKAVIVAVITYCVRATAI
jgi:hypothetical protein